MKFSIKDFFSKCDRIRRKLQICSHLLKKSLIKNFIFCVALLQILRTVMRSYLLIIGLSHYRHVSQKKLEGVMYSKVHDLLTENKILHEKQFGF